MCQNWAAWSSYIIFTCLHCSHFTRAQKGKVGISLMVQWLELHTFTTKGPGSISSWEIKILQATHHNKKQNKK